MPTERFNRLSEEKKSIIRKAAKKEFSRVPVDKVSINKIIKEADISRGSFYTYFEDKWDILNYIFEDSQSRMWQMAMETMRSSGGDVWHMLDSLLDSIIEICSEKENFDFIRNVMNHASPEEMMRGFERCGDGGMMGEIFAQRVYEECSKESFRIRSYPEFFAFFQLALVSVALALKAYFEGRPLERIRENFRLRMQILKAGVCLPAQEFLQR